MEQYFPVRPAAVYEIPQRLQFLLLQPVFFLPGRKIQRILKEYFVNFRHVVRQLIFEFSPVPGGGAYCPEHKFMLRHRFDILMHPGGYPACHIRIAALQYHTDTHLLASPCDYNIAVVGFD